MSTFHWDHFTGVFDMNGGYFLPTQVVADEDAQVAASSLVERR
jgi:phosphoribosyl 1,2-cyclic phosphodiesterase